MTIIELKDNFLRAASEGTFVELNSIYESNDKYRNNTQFIGDLCYKFKTRKEREWLNRILTSIHELRK